MRNWWTRHLKINVLKKTLNKNKFSLQMTPYHNDISAIMRDNILYM